MKCRKFWYYKLLNKNIRLFILDRNESSIKLMMINTFMHNVEIYSNMFGASIKNGVDRKVHGTNVITQKNGRCGKKFRVPLGELVTKLV